LLAAATCLCYANSFKGVFLFDDESAIVDNETIRALWPPRAVFEPPPNTTVSGRPLVNLTLAVNFALGGFDPRGYHAVNLAFHLLTGLVIFGIVRRALRAPVLAALTKSAC